MTGLYRGKVRQNVDPERRGRVQVEVPEVYGDSGLSWAMPCTPYAGDGVGFFAVPPVGAFVWVGFEADDIERPIVMGGFWGATQQLPVSLADPLHKAWVTDGVALRIDDVPGGGGLTIEVSSPVVAVPVTLKINSKGVELSTGESKISLDGVRVSVNGGALEVM